jgi:hypothetical protein
MNRVYEYLLYETNIDIDGTEPDEIIVVKTLNDKLSITKLDNRFTIIKVNESSIPLMNQYIETYRNDLFSGNALNFITEHFL